MTFFRGVTFVMAALLTSSLSAATLTVDLAGGGDFTDIQAAIDAASDGDTVLVRPGEYVIAEPIDFNSDRTLLGRGAGDAPLPGSRPAKNLIVRSESGPEETTIRLKCEAAAEQRASVVIFSKGETYDSVLEGFTLTGGTGTVLPWRTDRVGGGILCASNPTLRGCRITGNTADRGGGIWCAARPTLVDCVLAENSAAEGGGPYFPDDEPRLIGCAVIENVGGGVLAVESYPELVDCVISRNAGAGVEAWDDARAVLTGCLISENATSGVNGTAVLSGCTISSNGAHGVESGMLPVTLINCVIEGNGDAGINSSEPAAWRLNCIETWAAWWARGP